MNRPKPRLLVFVKRTHHMVSSVLAGFASSAVGGLSPKQLGMWTSPRQPVAAQMFRFILPNYCGMRIPSIPLAPRAPKSWAFPPINLDGRCEVTFSKGLCEAYNPPRQAGNTGSQPAGCNGQLRCLLGHEQAAKPTWRAALGNDQG